MISTEPKLSALRTQATIRPNPEQPDNLNPKVSIPWPSSLTDKNHRTELLKENDFFLITDHLGNINGFDHCLEGHSTQGTITGLFGKDSRFLSRSELQIEGKSPIPLGHHTKNGFGMEVTCTNPHLPDKLVSDKLSIHRKLAIRGALIEEISIQSFALEPVSFQVSLSFAADFRDVFELRQYANRNQWGESQSSHDQSSLTFTYQGLCNHEMSSRIEFQHRLPDQVVHQTLLWNLTLHPYETVTIGYRLIPKIDGEYTSHLPPAQSWSDAIASSQTEQDQWLKQATSIRTNLGAINDLIEQSEQDIYLLLQSFNHRKVLTAGIPWYSTLFGRDAIIAAQQTLILDSAIARDTLITLAEHQGQAVSAWHDEEPGKVMHELRLGEMARCHEIPHTPYYGTIDATPLWILLYVDYFHWTGDQETLDALWPNALAAMQWIENASDERGYLCYERQSKRGLDNQGWKDSDDCIVHGNGEIAQGAIALSEVQGYMYSAYDRMSEIAHSRGDIDHARHWKKKATHLKRSFNHDFWMEEQGFLALALTEDNTQVDSLTSNPGHCLGLGILEADKAEKVAQRLMEDDLFNGWGIRTLSKQSKAYNPISYHNGSVWPHDTALIAAGMRKIGHIEDTFTLTQGLFDLTQAQPDLRPPELFCGFDRQQKQPPIAYPVACSPQAWATGSIFQLLQLMLNPEPNANDRTVTFNRPSLPADIDTLDIHHLHFGQDWIDIRLHREDGYIHCEVQNHSPGLEVLIRP